jgi:menaquinone-specific isochorismate synthase
MIVPRVVLGRDGRGQAWLTTVTEPGEEAAASWPPAADGLAAPTDLRWQDGSLPGPLWEQAVGQAVAAIKAGHLRKVVLARDVFASAAGEIDARILVRRLAARYPDCFTFACDGMIGATPELLVRRAGREVSALVLGGTLPRGGDPAEDRALGRELLASAKNHEEHAYAVDSIREALGPLCETLHVDARPALLKFPNLQHLGTRVRGTLAGGGTLRSALALAAAVHPPAAVCGTPTGAALELIRELEQMDRERYAGPVGWVDADGNGEWGIALRCGQLSGPTARLFAGCGIVAGSEPAAELAETLVKLQPMRGALDG